MYTRLVASVHRWLCSVVKTSKEQINNSCSLIGGYHCIKENCHLFCFAFSESHLWHSVALDALKSNSFFFFFLC